MRRFWFWFRLLALTACAVVLGVYLLTSTPWRRWVGMEADYSTEIAKGNGIVAAIYGFKAERGLWPEYVEDVVPAYLEHMPGREWFYELEPVGAEGRVMPSLSRQVSKEGIGGQHLGFDFDPGAGGGAWHVFREGTDRIVRRGAPAGVAWQAAWEKLEGGRAQRALAELDRRMAREPLMIEHWEGKAGLLMALGRKGEARGVVAEAREKFPEAAWPRLAEVVLAEKAPPETQNAQRREEAETGEMREFVNWVKSQPSMTRWYSVSWLYRRNGEEEKAAEAMRQAIAQAIEVDKEDRHVAAYYLWDMGRWALARGRWDLVIAIADVWEKAEKEGRVKEKSYLALRAAARLAMGDVTGAKKDVEAAGREKGMWARDVGALSEAVARGDRGFRYEPGNVPGEFRVFEVPE